MDEKEGEFFKPQEKLSKSEEFRLFLWNPSTREFLGRTGISWLKITVFYIIFYAALAAFWAIMLLIFYQTLDYYQPTWKLDGSRIGTNPGLGYRPLPRPKNVDSTLIWFKHGSSNEWQYWEDALDEYLKDYRGGRQPGEYAKKCNIDTDNKDGEIVCQFALEDIDNNCTKSRHYGYDVGHPCVLIKLNRIFGWRHEPYDNDSFPAELPEEIRRVYDPRYVYISCQGENPADKENIGPLKYYPSQGIPHYYFPFINKEGYRSPFVFVHFEQPASGVLINVECKAWAKNVHHDRTERLGSTHFELLVD